jgi:porin
VDWTQYAQSICKGGRDDDKAYGGHIDMLMHLDLMRMGVLPGALVTVRAESRYGESVNGAAGPILPVNTSAFFPLTDNLDDGICITITNLYWTQFLSEHFAVFAGKADTLDGDPNEFASGRGKTQFMSATFIFNPVVALRLPYSTLAAGFAWLPNENIEIKGVMMNTSDSSTTTGFNDFGDGVTFTLEGDFQYRLGDLPGGVNIGGLFSCDQDFADVQGLLIFRPGEGLEVATKDDTWAIYASMWQYLWVEDPNTKPINAGDGVPDHQGVGIFARIGGADKDTNPIHYSASCGIGGRGIIPSRDNDTFGVGYYYTSFQSGRFTNLLNVDDEGQGAEAFYNIALTPAVDLTFDAQVQDTPFPRADTAIILGMRLNMKF